MKNILILSATAFEVKPFSEYLKGQFKQITEHHYESHKIRIHILISDVGIAATTYSLTKYLQHNRTDLIIHMGIAGAIDQALKIGDVVQITEDEFYQLGAEEAEGHFSSIFDMGLSHPNRSPFTNGKLQINSASFLPSVKGITVSKVHGHEDSIAKIPIHAQIETMEAAAAMYVSIQEQVAILSIRSISNMVEARNKENWDIGLAIETLTKTMVEIISELVET